MVEIRGKQGKKGATGQKPLSKGHAFLKRGNVAAMESLVTVHKRKWVLEQGWDKRHTAGQQRRCFQLY